MSSRTTRSSAAADGRVAKKRAASGAAPAGGKRPALQARDGNSKPVGAAPAAKKVRGSARRAARRRAAAPAPPRAGRGVRRRALAARRAPRNAAAKPPFAGMGGAHWFGDIYSVRGEIGRFARGRGALGRAPWRPRTPAAIAPRAARCTPRARIAAAAAEC